MAKMAEVEVRLNSAEVSLVRNALMSYVGANYEIETRRRLLDRVAAIVRHLENPVRGQHTDRS